MNPNNKYQQWLEWIMLQLVINKFHFWVDWKLLKSKYHWLLIIYSVEMQLCTTCMAKIEDSLLKMHYRSDLHNYNLMRKRV